MVASSLIAALSFSAILRSYAHPLLGNQDDLADDAAL